MKKSNVKILRVKLRDLQPILREKYGEELEVVSYVADSLLPSGENYGSSIFKVRAIVKNNGTEEELHLVAKMVPPTDIQRAVFDSPYTFKKEAFLYRELIPSYRSLEVEFGLSEDAIFDIAPEFYGARYSLRSEDDFDDDAVILMRNLKVLGYYMGDRKTGLDLEHSKVAVTAVARFHALGIAMRQHKPRNFETLKAQAGIRHGASSGFDERLKYFLQLMLDDPELSTHREQLRVVMSREYAFFVTPPLETWSTIIHNDFWVNNFMFLKDSKTERVTDIKFVDFQNYHNSSPQRELIFFLMTSLNIDVMAHHFEDIIDTYYEAFIEVLERMKITTEAFSRDKFDERMKADASAEISHWLIILRVMSADVVAKEASADHIENIFSNGTVSTLFRERLRRCVKKYAEKGWLGED